MHFLSAQSPASAPAGDGERGFTLAELAVVLLIVSILAAALIVPVSGREENRRRHETEAALEEVREALIGFAIIHRRLPCATHQTDPSSADYGLEDMACSKSTEGYLPWRTLGVEAHDAWGVPRTASTDPWTGYWRYRADPALSAPSATIDVGLALADDLRVKDSDGSTMVDGKTLAALVYSTGPNGIADGENGSYEPGLTATYQTGEPGTTFDDILAWIGHPLLIARMAAAGSL